MRKAAVNGKRPATAFFFYGNVFIKGVGFVDTKKIAGRPPVKYDLC